MPSDVTAPAIIEYIRYDLPPDRRPAFEAAYARVGGILTASPHCLGWELRRSVEKPGHVDGFRESAPFRTFFGELSVFAEFRREMEHFELVRNQPSTAESQ